MPPHGHVSTVLIAVLYNVSWTVNIHSQESNRLGLGYNLYVSMMTLIVKSLNQTIVTGGDKLGHRLYNWLTMHLNQFKRGCSKFSSQGDATWMRWHVNGWQFFSASQWYLIWKHQTGNSICPCICCQVHVFEKYPETLLNTMIKYNMNKHSGPLFQKSNVSPPPLGW